jgi:F-type H+-transporting ATPase subunit epsilon
MPENMELEIVSSTAEVFKAEVKELYVPAYLGEAGILENHLPYLSLINAGELYYKDNNDKHHYLYITEGFLEVLDNKIVVISDSIEKGEGFAKEEIEKKLREIAAIIKSASSLEAGITAAALDKALQDQKEYKTKLDIVKKIESK